MVNVGADGEAYCKALEGVLVPREDEGGKALAGFVEEFDSPKAHVKVQDGNKGKSLNIVHNVLDGWERKRASAKIVVEHMEVSNELDLIVFLGTANPCAALLKSLLHQRTPMLQRWLTRGRSASRT